MNESDKAYKVKVGEVAPPTKHDVVWIVTWPTNPAAKAALGSITVGICPDVWDGKSPPKVDEHLVVEDVRQKSRGWNAHKARYFRPKDREDPEIVQ